ncbi:MAG: Gfo/Idh/MocA family oxidoreductase [Fuerstiella sp.]|nr:Gfo/Idh/MocA family oxidoreductase [Fuerstiella sp.]
MLKSVGLAVSGLGWIGKKHAELIKMHDGCQLLGLCDTDSGRRRIAKQLDVPFYQHIEELIERERPDGAIIATPNQWHAEIAETCAQRGVHVLIEKPIADTLSAARRIQHASDDTGIRVLIGHHRRHNPLIQKTRDIIRSGTLGKLVGVSMLWALMKPAEYFDVDWRCRSPGGGPNFINLIHEFDTLRFVCGEIRQVCAFADSVVRKLDVEDSLSIAISFESGALGSIFASDTASSPWSWETTTGENSHYFHADRNCYRFLGTSASLAFPKMELWEYADNAQTDWQHPMKMSQRQVVHADPLQLQLEHFCRVVRQDERPMIDAREGTRSLAVTLAVQKSIRDRIPVDVEAISSCS